MTDESNGWTFKTLLHLIDVRFSEIDRRNEQRFEGQEKAVNAALTAAKEAVIKAELAAEKRFEAVNEFRGQLGDQAATLMPRIEAEQRLGQLTEKLEGMEKRLNTASGRSSGLNAGWAYLATFIAAASALVALVVTLAW